MRRNHSSVIRKRSRRMCKLKECERVVALSNAERRCVANIPRLLKPLLFPFPVGKYASLLTDQVNAGLLAKSPRFHEIVNTIYAQLCSKPVVENIRRNFKRPSNVDDPFRRACHIAKAVVPNHEDPCIVQLEVFANFAVVESR